MKVSLAILAAFVFLSHVEAAEDLKAARKRCEALQDEIDTLLIKGTAKIAKEKVPAALALAEKFKFPTEAESREIPQQLKDRQESAMVGFLNLGAKDCSIVRFKLVKALAGSGNDASIRAAVRKLVLAPKYPTLMNAMIDSALLESLVDESFVKFSETEKKQLKDLRAEMKKFAGEITSSSEGPWDKIATEYEKTPEAKRVDFLKKSPEAQKLKALMLRELEESVKYLERVRKASASL